MLQGKTLAKATFASHFKKAACAAHHTNIFKISYPNYCSVIFTYFMIHTFYFVIQQPFFNVQPSWIFNKLKVLGGLERSREERGQMAASWQRSIRVFFGNQLCYPVNSDFSGGQRCPPFEQLGPDKDINQISLKKMLNFLNLKKSAQFLQVFIHMSILAILSYSQQGNSFIADSKVLNHETEPWLFEVTCFPSLKRLQRAWHWPFKLYWAMKTTKRVVFVKNKQCFLL